MLMKKAPSGAGLFSFHNVYGNSNGQDQNSVAFTPLRCCFLTLDPLPIAKETDQENASNTQAEADADQQ